MSAQEPVGPQSMTVCIALARGALEAAEHNLKDFGGKDLLGYALSHGLWLDGRKGALKYAEVIRNYVDAQAQLEEAIKIAKWNQEAARSTKESETP